MKSQSFEEDIHILLSILFVTIALSVIALSVIAACSGCATTPAQRPITPQRASTVLQTTAQAGVVYAVHKDPNARAYFLAAVVALDALADAGKYDPASLDQALTTISVKEVRSDEAKLAISAALSLYVGFFGENVSAKIDAWKPVLIGLRNGINDGLQLTLQK